MAEIGQKLTDMWLTYVWFVPSMWLKAGQNEAKMWLTCGGHVAEMWLTFEKMEDDL